MHTVKDLKTAQNLVLKWNYNKYFDESYQYQEQCYLPDIINELNKLDRQFNNALDIGPGYGSLATFIKANYAKNVTMMDIMPLDHWIAYDYLNRFGLKFIQQDVFELHDFEKYDLITMTQVIPHLKYRPDLAIQNIYDSLTKDGVFITCILNNCTNEHVLSDIRKDWETVPKYKIQKESTSTVICMYNIEDFKRLLQTSFENIKIYTNDSKIELIAVCKKG